MFKSIIISLTIIIGSINAFNGPLLTTQYGPIRGTWLTSARGRQYAAFKGVPFAKPPLGKLRFKDPSPLKAWQGTWDASKYGSICLQFDPFQASQGIIGNEDCLYLNIYTPSLDVNTSLPVVIFIHGGAFMYGAGSLYGASNLMDRDVVFVTLNYRLGPLGFLSTEDDVVAGNMGLKDQAYALRWIKQNINTFGGNPASITLTGLSAGGASVHYQYLSNWSADTFARGIAISGSSLNPWALSKKPLEKAKSLATYIGCPTSTNKEMVECLRNRPADSITHAQTYFNNVKHQFFTVFTPSVEGKNVKEPFINKSPYEIMKNGQNLRLPLIMSFTSEEGLYPAAAYINDPNILEELNRDWSNLASSIFEYRDTCLPTRKLETAQTIRNKYLANKEININSFPQLVEALTDRLFVSDIGSTVSLHASNGGHPVYLYKYAVRGEFSLTKVFTGTDTFYGVAHADDVLHVLEFGPLQVKTERGRQISDMLIDMYMTFAVEGIPRAKVEWPPVQSNQNGEINYLQINDVNEMQMMNGTDLGNKAFWDGLSFIENENINVWSRDEL